MAPQSNEVPDTSPVAYVTWVPPRRLQEPDLDALASALEGVDSEFCLQHDATDAGPVIVSLQAQNKEPVAAAREAASTTTTVAADLGLQGEVVNVEVLSEEAGWGFSADELRRGPQH